MKTTVYDFLEKYSNDKIMRLHMPGHKGKSVKPLSFTHDITEINGADSLFEADGIIAESEKNATELFKSFRTYYSAGGSTLCIQTMLAIVRRDKRNIIAVRNVHRSFLAACVLLDIQPQWVYPKYSGGFLSGKISLNSLEEKLKITDNACVYITSPDYLGRTADIKVIADLCHKYNAVLLVDNAHGAHNAGNKNHPVMQGADMCCDSAHKMLPALTGAAYLHINKREYAVYAKQEMSLFASTSPSYLIMASLDLCNDYIEKKLEADTLAALLALKGLREKIREKYEVYDSEPFHLTLLCNGGSLSRQLREKGIECEYADSYCIVLLFSPMNTPDEIEETADILMTCRPEKSAEDICFDFPVMESAMSVRKAALSGFEKIPVEKSLGRICAAVNVPCPPAVPIAVSGEVINENCIKIFEKYSIFTVNVIK
ncbi:MAG: aminotransferase class I/II-fold pyridoxal phosphate-dependent enzyme [Oscillospiraceae bacterium]|nr:aminotransferase class I/II-fold pyridoxal phosphate-dependent enzyme [Oscillospiraceae bacterium]